MPSLLAHSFPCHIQKLDHIFHIPNNIPIMILRGFWKTFIWCGGFFHRRSCLCNPRHLPGFRNFGDLDATFRLEVNVLFVPEPCQTAEFQTLKFQRFRFVSLTSSSPPFQLPIIRPHRRAIRRKIVCKIARSFWPVEERLGYGEI